MSASTVCGVRIAECAGRSASSSAPTAGRSAWRDGTKTCGICREAVELGLASSASLRREHRRHDARVGLSDDDRVDDPGERHGVGERERPAGEDERMASVAFPPPRGNAGRVEHAHEPGDLELVGDAEREHRELFDRAQRLVRDRSLGLERSVRLALVVEKGALARQPGRLHEGTVDSLVAEGAHPGRVGRRIAERDRQRRLLVYPTYLVGQSPPDTLAQGGGGQTVPARVLTHFPALRNVAPLRERRESRRESQERKRERSSEKLQSPGISRSFPFPPCLPLSRC